MNLWQVTQIFLIRWLQWLSEAGGVSPGIGPLDKVWVALGLAGSPNVGPFTQLSDLTEASYHGYARQQVAWYPVYQSTDGNVTLEGGSLFFAPTDSVLSQTVSLIFLVDALTGGTLLAGAAIPLPGVVMSNPLSVVKVLPNFKLGFAPVYGGVVLES